MKKYLLTALSLILTVPAFAFEDCIISTDGKLTDIKIQHNDIIDVFPMITVMNDKNTLIVHPLKEGTTKFTVMKNNKNKYLFSVNVSDEGTEINTVEGFDILAVDCPPGTYEYNFDLDEPPESEITKNENNDCIDDLDEPPVLRGEK